MGSAITGDTGASSVRRSCSREPICIYLDMSIRIPCCCNCDRTTYSSFLLPISSSIPVPGLSSIVSCAVLVVTTCSSFNILWRFPNACQRRLKLSEQGIYFQALQYYNRSLTAMAEPLPLPTPTSRQLTNTTVASTQLRLP